jgi:hypothetical protein
MKFDWSNVMASFRYKHLAIAASLLPFVFAVILLSTAWIYMTASLERAHSKGVYPSAEQGMIARIEQWYIEVDRIDILYAGPNSSDRQPHVWYVIAEVRAASQADGSAMTRHGCSALGSFFLQSKEGWVFVPENDFPELLGFWMSVFGQAGPGQVTPLATSQLGLFCRSP